MSLLAQVGLVFTLLLQQEGMTSVQKDPANSLRALSEQTRLSLDAARRHALAALQVTSETHRQAVADNHASASGLLDQKEWLTREILEISDRLDRRAQSKD